MLPRHKNTLRLALIFIGFQAAWFACILGVARGLPWSGITAVAVVVGLQLLASSAPRQDVILVALAMALGLVWDTALLQLGVVEYAAAGPVAGAAPAWILALWALLGVNLREALQWLHGRWWLAAVVGGVAGALSYVGAVRLGAGRLPDVGLAVGVLALGWAVMTPLLTESARRQAAATTRRKEAP